MSQEKVDRYKKEKANRKQIMRRQKIMNYVRTAIVGVVAVVIVGWVGFSAYRTYDENRETESVSIDYSALDNLETSIAEADE